MVDMPTRSRVEAWRFDHLETAATSWAIQASVTEEAFNRAVQSVGSVKWDGAAGDRARDEIFADLVKVRSALDHLRQAEQVARRGANALAAAKQDVLAAISNAEGQFFAVSEDLHVTDRLPAIFSIPLSVFRRVQAAHMQADIQAKALRLAATDEQIASALTPLADALRDFTLGGPSGTGGPGSPGGPTITGPAGPLTKDDDKADLNATLPGTDIVIGGDGRTGYPTLNGQENPLDVGNPPGQHNTRPLPTGTIVGPDGKQYALYSEVPYNIGKDPNPNYATPDTTVVDLADPSKRIGVLPRISQASGAYDPKTNRMVIVGNTGPNRGDRTRMLYESDPIDPANPNAWMSTLHPVGEIKGLPGDRENQLVALKGGGFMLVGSDNVTGPGSQPMSAITAATPEGLLTAKPTNLFPPGPQQNWPGNAPPYGPTVVDTTYDPVTGKENVQLRVSTWEDPPGWDPKTQPTKPYNPSTYTTNVTIQH
jgi:hypothetical protein